MGKSNSCENLVTIKTTAFGKFTSFDRRKNIDKLAQLKVIYVVNTGKLCIDKIKKHSLILDEQNIPLKTRRIEHSADDMTLVQDKQRQF